MSSQTIITLLSITLPLVGAAIGFLVKYIMEKNKELSSEVTKERRLIYQQYVNLIMDVFANTKGNGKEPNLVKELYGFYKKYVLYASPNVIKAFSDYFQFLYNNTDVEVDIKKNIQLLSKIMLEMRKDLGLKNVGLGENGEMLLRAILKDYDAFIK